MEPTVRAYYEQALGTALDNQRSLITAALSAGGPGAVVTELARALDGWVVLLDEAGVARHCAPGAARKHAAQIRQDLDRLALDTPLQAASLAMGGDQVAILPVGVHGRVAGYLAFGREQAPSPVEHSVLTSAVGLLALDISGTEKAEETERRARLAVLRLAEMGYAELAGSTADTLAVAIPPEPLRVAVLGADRELIDDLLRAAEEQQALNQGSALTARYDRRSVAVLLPVAEGDLQALEEVLHRVPRSRGVTSEGVPFAEIPDALRRVRSVFYGSPEGRDQLLLAKDVATEGLLAQLDNPSAHGWASALLEPLDRHANRSKLDLIATLRVFLTHNGHIDVSSTELGIHRHTLRYRLGRIRELLDTSLDDPTTRAELWLALRLREVG